MTCARLGYPEREVVAIERADEARDEQDDYPEVHRARATQPARREVKLADVEDNMDIKRLESLARRTSNGWRSTNAARRRLLDAR